MHVAESEFSAAQIVSYTLCLGFIILPRPRRADHLYINVCINRGIIYAFQYDGYLFLELITPTIAV